MHPIIPDPKQMSPLEVAARTVFGEARGETQVGKLAVASVICNRAMNPSWWGDDIKSVCLKPWAFSCWNAKSPTRPATVNTPLHDSRLSEIFEILMELTSGHQKDPTNNCDHYCRTDAIPHIHWARGATPVVTIGNHTFFRLFLKENEPDADFFDAAPVAS